MGLVRVVMLTGHARRHTPMPGYGYSMHDRVGSATSNVWHILFDTVTNHQRLVYAQWSLKT